MRVRAPKDLSAADNLFNMSFGFPTMKNIVKALPSPFVIPEKAGTQAENETVYRGH